MELSTHRGHRPPRYRSSRAAWARAGALTLTLVVLLSAASSQAELHDPFDALLGTYVFGKRVDYAAWSAQAKDVAALGRYVESLEATDAAGLEGDAALAFWINLYNSTTLRLILDNYPVESIKDLGGVLSSPWKQKLVKVNGRELTLDQIENEIIRPTFQDARIHFALNCAAKSCPPLAPYAFTADQLPLQLDRVTMWAINDEEFVSIDPQHDRAVVRVTKLFDWYKDDWENVGEFLAQYRPQDKAIFLDDSTRLKYNDYDWKLNDRSTP